MKKYLLIGILIIAVLTTAFADDYYNYNDFDYSQALKDATNAYKNITPEQKRAIEESVSSEGVEVKITDTGFIYKDEDGEGQYGGEWPNNKYTQMVPKPNFGTVMATYIEYDSCNVTLCDVTVDQMKAYASKVKQQGFNIDVEVEDSTAFGVTIYSYSARNKKGYEVEVSFAVGLGNITIEKD